MTNFDVIQEELKVLSFWKDIDAFKTSLELSKGRKQFSFYDGPPFATGLPHYGHVLASTIKDIVTRYAHNTGHYVDRRFGWDCHGLPVEHEIDKKLGINGKEDIMAIGIEKYNSECRAIVMRYSEQWREKIERLGRWIEFDNDYKTLDTLFMQSVWYIFKKLYEKGKVYRGFKVMPYSTACMTPLSNFEAQQNYKKVSDPSVVISFPLLEDPSTSLLAWTTTPWTLPSHLNLCVNPDFEYIKIYDEASGENYILLEKCLSILYKDPKNAKFTKLQTIKGADMKGWKYDPPFYYFYERFKERAFNVLLAQYVTSDNGTGIVHQAPAFGEDDYNVAFENGIIDENFYPPCPLDEKGNFTAEVSDFAGMYVKDADKAIQKVLKQKKRLVIQSQIIHSYPFCWRSDTPLLYRVVPSWFVKVKESTKEMLEALESTRWVPSFVKDKRFANWITGCRDWNISRNRYWGTPIPLWVSDDFEEIVCIGSVSELEELSGVRNLTDIHRDKIDHITIPSKKGKNALKRIEDVFDCWFESGSMPYASVYYPFQNSENFMEKFPADFIAEGLDQTRGWFYTLLVLGVQLFGIAPFKNVIVNGLVLASDGKKMSKRLKNYPELSIVLDKYGADALRLYLINSPVVRAEPLKFKEDGVKDVVAKVIIPWWNSYNFFEMQVKLLKKTHNIDFMYNLSNEVSDNVTDKWILSSCQSLISFIKKEMSEYRLYTVVPMLLKLIEDMTNWYIRFNRQRLKGMYGKDDTLIALNVLFDVLYTLCRTMAPFTPFLTEAIYQNLKKYIPKTTEDDVRSIHFVSFPDVIEERFQLDVERKFNRMQKVVDLARNLREKESVRLKVPLKQLVVIHHDEQYLSDIKSVEQYIKEELNIRDLFLSPNEEEYGVRYSLVADWPVLGKRLRKDIVKVKDFLSNVTSEQAKEFMKNKEIIVDDIKLVEGDLQVIRTLDFKDTMYYQTNTDQDVFIILDTKIYPELKTEYLVREVINRVQRLRKKVGLQVIDDIRMEYVIIDDSIGLEDAISQHQILLTKILRRPLEKNQSILDETDPKQIVKEKQDVQGATFMLSLLRL
ncbi:isoleucine-tRNA ligase [Pneumocystis carinii B80]|uniref:Isoleucine--tRNA ligase, cytoplasmic n=1 Tax=Pneumocystis carinii (strain B80) TaxID=1408658 RepID=A0A0W4ZDE4_PNEC8|nr:isoleucine-tRNA ligase [Pneumocystis carinii B80]KTW26416.1 isoleucine-tRNA ligase [Pneumocystis carinii B80]